VLEMKLMTTTTTLRADGKGKRELGCAEMVI
jgi:hypothetical protein